MLASVDPGPVPPQVHFAVTATSSLHAAGAVGPLHVFVEALNLKEENKQLMTFDPKKRENIRMLTSTGVAIITTFRATFALSHHAGS